MTFLSDNCLSVMSNEPFKHYVFDNFLAPNVADDLATFFPSADGDWYTYDNFFEKKRAQDKIHKMPNHHAIVCMFGNSGPFVEFLEQTTGITGLIPDPALRGGGLHQIYPGGKLDIHADFNFHKKLGLHRRLNAILYLNKGWERAWGGDLELWDKSMTSCAVRLEPIFNRFVVFETTDTAFHGHPEPLKCPDGVTRKSMAWYYYTSSPGVEVTKPHSTMFKKRPSDQTNSDIERLREERGAGRIS